MVEGSSGCWRKNTQAEMPMAKATGIPMRSSTVKATLTQTIRLHVGRAPRACDCRLNLRMSWREECGADRQAHRHPE